MKEFVEGLKKHLEAKYSWLGDVSCLMADIDSFAETFEKKSAHNEWIPWNGGECPVSGDTIVDVMFPEDSEYPIALGVAAEEWDWSHGFYYEESNIIAYRIHKEG